MNEDLKFEEGVDKGEIDPDQPEMITAPVLLVGDELIDISVFCGPHCTDDYCLCGDPPGSY